jgi:alanine racemase
MEVTPTSDITHRAPVTALINLSALAHNVGQLRRHIPRDCHILAIVKADAYGHGTIPIATALIDLGITRLGVATVQEGIHLREHGIQGKIIVLGGLLSSQIGDIVQYHLTPVISDPNLLPLLSQHLPAHRHPYPIHLKVDTGMHRLGMDPQSLQSVLHSSLLGPTFQLEGIMTHLADADNPDPTYSTSQLEQFQSLVNLVQSEGYSIPLVHAANTAGILCHEASHFSMVRPGLMLYGYAPPSSSLSRHTLQPIMEVKTKIVHIRTVKGNEPLSYNGSFRTKGPSRIAILPIGYAHGYNRRLWNRGHVLVGNRRAPIVGKICMDMTLIDVTEIPEAHGEAEVVILGKQGDEEITAKDIADWQDTIPYEVLCNLGPRLHRVYESPLVP